MTGPDGSLRPAIEDLLGAGAIIAALNGSPSAEAMTARDAFHAAEAILAERLRASVSGRELIGHGFPQDVEIAVALNASQTAPRMQGGAFTG